jgi:hypothetical protein
MSANIISEIPVIFLPVLTGNILAQTRHPFFLVLMCALDDRKVSPVKYYLVNLTTIKIFFFQAQIFISQISLFTGLTFLFI